MEFSGKKFFRYFVEKLCNIIQIMEVREFCILCSFNFDFKNVQVFNLVYWIYNIFMFIELGVIFQVSCKGFLKFQINLDGRKLIILDIFFIYEYLVVYNLGYFIIYRVRDSYFIQYRDYVIFVNGRYYVVVVKVLSNVYTLFVYGLETVLVFDVVMKIFDLYFDIKLLFLFFIDRVDVKWFSDSRFVVVGFSKGELIVVDWKKG